MPGVNTLAWLIAIFGMIMFVPWPVIGSLLVVLAIYLRGWWGDDLSEWGEMLMFFGAIAGIVAVYLP